MRREATLGSDSLRPRCESVCMRHKAHWDKVPLAPGLCRPSLNLLAFFFFPWMFVSRSHLNPGDGNLIDLHVSGPSAAGRQDLSFFFFCVGAWRDGGGAKNGEFGSLLSNHHSPSPHCSSWAGGGGRGAEPDKGRQRSWRKTAYATHAWIAAHRFHLFIYFSKIQRPATERSSMKLSSQQGSRDAASVSEHPNGL